MLLFFRWRPTYFFLELSDYKVNYSENDKNSCPLWQWTFPIRDITGCLEEKMEKLLWTAEYILHHTNCRVIESSVTVYHFKPLNAHNTHLCRQPAHVCCSIHPINCSKSFTFMLIYAEMKSAGDGPWAVDECCDSCPLEATYRGVCSPTVGSGQ